MPLVNVVKGPLNLSMLSTRERFNNTEEEKFKSQKNNVK